MLNFMNIPFADINLFLQQNIADRPIDTQVYSPLWQLILANYDNILSGKIDKDQAYTFAWDLILDKHVITAPPSINNWITAYNLKCNGSSISTYKTSEILLSPDQQLTDLSPEINKEHIIRILGYLDKLDNDMNVFDLLPLEILRYILLLLERKTIKYLHYVLCNARKLNLRELLNLRRSAAYPRSSRHCNMHYMSGAIINLKNKFIVSDSRLFLTMEYFDSLNIDVVKGDLVKFDSDGIICIFNGQKIIHLDYADNEYGALPREFHVIENDVPIRYWHNYCLNLVWFNHNLVKDQCLANIKYGLIGIDKYAIFTTFIYNMKIYKIFYIYMDDAVNINLYTYEFLDERERDKYMEEFKVDLSSDRELIFGHFDENYDEHDEDNILYRWYKC